MTTDFEMLENALYSGRPEPEEKATSAHLCENWKETDDYCYLCAPKGWAEPEPEPEPEREPEEAADASDLLKEIGDLHVIGDDHTEVSIWYNSDLASGYIDDEPVGDFFCVDAFAQFGDGVGDLDLIFEEYNRIDQEHSRLDELQLRSMSVGDVIVVKMEGRQSAYYVRSVGFKSVEFPPVPEEPFDPIGQWYETGEGRWVFKTPDERRTH